MDACVHPLECCIFNPSGHHHLAGESHATNWEDDASAYDHACNFGLPVTRTVLLAQTSDGDQERAIAAIEKLGGKVDRYWTGGACGVDLSRARAGDAELADLKRIGPVRTVNLAGTRITDAGLAEFEGMAHLRKLNLAGTRITDAGLVRLREIDHLRA